MSHDRQQPEPQPIEGMPTWEDVERAARFDIVLQTTVTMVRMGVLTREQSLIVAVLTLSRTVDEAYKRITAMISGERT